MGGKGVVTHAWLDSMGVTNAKLVREGFNNPGMALLVMLDVQ